MTISATRFSYKTLERAVEALPPTAKLRLLQRLEQQTWADRLNRLLARIDARVRRRPVSEGAITALVEPVRQELYAQRGR